MSFTDPILNFVAQPENLSIALEIADQVAQIKEAYHRTYWQMVEAEMESRLVQSGLDNAWFVRPLPEGKLFTPYLGYALVPQASKIRRKQPWLTACLHQGTKDSQYHLYYGFKWTQAEKPQSPEIEILRSQLSRAGFNVRSSEQWWAGWKWLNYHLYHPEFLVRLSQDADLLVKETVGILWDLFSEHLPQLHAVHHTFEQS